MKLRSLKRTRRFGTYPRLRLTPNYSWPQRTNRDRLVSLSRLNVNTEWRHKRRAFEQGDLNELLSPRSHCRRRRASSHEGSTYPIGFWGRRMTRNPGNFAVFHLLPHLRASLSSREVGPCLPVVSLRDRQEGAPAAWLRSGVPMFKASLNPAALGVVGVADPMDFLRRNQ